jgi:hypothetical protein
VVLVHEERKRSEEKRREEKRREEKRREDYKQFIKFNKNQLGAPLF